MSPPPEERAKGVILPDWWLEKVRELVEERGTTLGEVAIALSEVVQRNDAWDHSAVSRFLRNKVTTAPMAEAFSKLLGIPPAFYVPRNFDEALALQAVSKRHDEPRLTAEQVRRLAVVDEVVESEGATSADRRGGVQSSDEGVVRRGRPRRAARGRPSSS